MKKPCSMPPLDEPLDIDCFGGLVSWFSISLSIAADDLDPDEVTRLLGIEPDESRRRGVPDKRGQTSSRGIWSVRMRHEQTSEKNVGVAIGMLLDRIPASAEAWGHARALGDARIFVGLRFETGNCGLGLSIDLMTRLADLGLRLDLDIYAILAGEDLGSMPQLKT